MDIDLVLVTGGAGFIGSAIVDLLATYREMLGIEKIVVIDNLYSGSLENIREAIQRGTAFVYCDIASYEELLSALKSFLDTYRGSIGIIHLAAIVSIVEVYRDPARGFRVNVNGTLNLLEIARRFDVEKIVFASSAAVYGEPMYIPIDEDHPIRPANLYGLTKAIGEQLIERYRADYGVHRVILRYFNVYGPRMRGGAYAGVVHNFIVSLIRGSQPVIYGDGMQTRDFVYVYDVAQATVDALTKPVEGVFNIGSGRETKIIELYDTICKIMGRCLPPRYEPPRVGDVRRSCASIERAKEVLGWSPRVSLEEGLRETIRWYLFKGIGIRSTY